MSVNDYTKYAKVAKETVEAPVEEVIEPVVEEHFVTGTIIEPETPAESESVATIEEDDPDGPCDGLKNDEALEPEIIPQPKIGRVYGCAKVNVRKAPDTKAEVVCTLFCHTEVEIGEPESTEDFYKIYTPSGIEGYCMKAYILEK